MAEARSAIRAQPAFPGAGKIEAQKNPLGAACLAGGVEGVAGRLGHIVAKMATMVALQVVCTYASRSVTEAALDALKGRGPRVGSVTDGEVGLKIYVTNTIKIVLMIYVRPLGL